MTFVRGFVWAEYVDDTGTTWALRVDADSAQDPNRGWSFPAPDGVQPLPRQWQPRLVFGNDAQGNTRRARIGRTDAALWTGAVDTFQLQGSDFQLHTITVIGKLSEKRRSP